MKPILILCLIALTMGVKAQHNSIFVAPVYHICIKWDLLLGMKDTSKVDEFGRVIQMKDVEVYDNHEKCYNDSAAAIHFYNKVLDAQAEANRKFSIFDHSQKIYHVQIYYIPYK